MPKDLEAIIRELTECAQPPPFTIEQPATMSSAKRLFDPLKKSGVHPPVEDVYNLLIKYHWEDKHARHLLRKFAAYFK